MAAEQAEQDDMPAEQAGAGRTTVGSGDAVPMGVDKAERRSVTGADAANIAHVGGGGGG